MTTKVVDSTVSQLLQDNSSVEYVAPETNPIATIPNADTPSRKSEDTPLFDFNAEHNGIQCIESLKPEDRGTERQFWFSARMLATVFDCADPKTVRSRIETLVNTGDLDEGKNFLSSQMPYSNGSVHDIVLYDLTVFNKLAMTFIDNPRAVEMRKAFNDVLVKAETGCIRTVEDMINNPDTAIQLLSQIKSLRQQNKQLEMERDEAIRTKYHFVEGRDAKVCGELGGLRTQNEALRKQIGDSKTHKAVTAITWLPDYFDISNRGIYIALAAKLKKLEAEMPPKYAHTDIQDSRWGSVKAYHVAVIERLHEMVQADENLMKKYRKIASV